MKHVLGSILAAGLGAMLVMNPIAKAQTCPADMQSEKFQAEMHKLAARNSTPRQAFDAVKTDFGLTKTAVDLIDNLNAGKFTKELQFIHAWHQADKAVDINTSSELFSRWQVYVGSSGQPPSFVANTATTMNYMGHGLTALSLAINAYDVFNGDAKAYKAATVDIYKTTQSIAFAKYGTQSLSAAMVGVGFMDYALNEYMKTAYKKYEDYWWQGYDGYLKHTYSRASWAQLYETQGQAGVDARLREFWDDPYTHVATYNQAKTRVISNDALAGKDYPDQFAARYMAETLVPGLGYYYKQKAEAAQMEIEWKLERECELLMREITKIKDLKKAIDAARKEMNRSANQADTGDKAGKTDTASQPDATQSVSLNEGEGDAEPNAPDQGRDFAGHLDAVAAKLEQEAPPSGVQEPAPPQEPPVDAADDAKFMQAMEKLSEMVKADQRGELDAEGQALLRKVFGEDPANPADAGGPVNAGAEAEAEDDDFMQQAEMMAAMIEAEKRGELDPQGQEILDKVFDEPSAAASQAVAARDDDNADTGDDWDDAADADAMVASNVSEQQKWKLRQEMAQNQQADQARANANANQKYAVAQQQRAEEARRKAQARQEFAASMAALANGLQQVVEAERQNELQRQAAVAKNKQDVAKVMQAGKLNAQWRSQVDACARGLMSSRNGGYPITDPYVARSRCETKLASTRPVPATSTRPSSPTPTYSRPVPTTSVNPQNRAQMDACVKRLMSDPNYPITDIYVARSRCTSSAGSSSAGRVSSTNRPTASRTQPTYSAPPAQSQYQAPTVVRRTGPTDCECYQDGYSDGSAFGDCANPHDKPRKMEGCATHSMGPMTPWLGGCFDATKDTSYIGPGGYGGKNGWCK